MNQSTLVLDAFRGLCRNEGYATTRDIFPVIALAGRAIATDASVARMVTNDARSYEDTARIRAVYFLRLIRQAMEEAPGAIVDAWLEQNKTLRLATPAPFFHADEPPAQCFDDLAVELGFNRGLELSKVRQLLEFGTA